MTNWLIHRMLRLLLEAGAVMDYCDVAKCQPCQTGGCAGDPVMFCCSPSGACVPTTLLGNCDPDDFVAVCEYGQSLPDGSFECFDDE